MERVESVVATMKEPAVDETYVASEYYDRIFGPDEVKWFKSQTGIETDEELKEHVIAVQEEAWSVSRSAFSIRICSNKK